VTDAVSQLAVIQPNDDQDHDELRAAAASAAGGGGIEVLTWPEAMPEVYEYIVLDMVGMWVMLGALMLMAAIGVLNTVLMSVLERVREFGVMLSLGLSRARLASIVLLESLLIGVLAAGLGLGVGAAASYPLVVNGIDVSEMMGAENLEVAGTSMSAMLYGHIIWSKIFIFTLLTILVTALAGIYPVWWTLRLTPIKALQHR
jgi:ABC-type lipoprotein release transport system permease subunit